MKNLIPIYLLLVGVACGSVKNNEAIKEIEIPSVKYPRHSRNIDKIFEAHGGYGTWAGMKELSFNKGEERHLISLRNRNSIIESPDRTIGFDGSQVWVSPESAKVEGARFYHNLYFYFYAMPFVLGDPGVFYEDIEDREILGKTYAGIKISYDNGVGDSPKDNYIIWYDSETYKMEWLMYTVTFRSGEVSQNYRLIKYDKWEEFNDLVLPTAIQWYNFENDSIKDMRNEVVFDSIFISEKSPRMDLFQVPEGAQIAPLQTSD